MSYVFTIESDGNSANSAEYNTLAECNSALNSRRQSAIANSETFTFGGCTGSPTDTSSNPSSNNTIGATNNSSGGTPYTYLEPLSSTSSSVEISEAGFSTYLQLVMTVGIAVLVIIGVFYLIYGGIMYMTTDVINNKNRGRSMISNAVVGVVFALSIWLILNAINPDMLNIRLGGFGTNVSSGNSTGGLSTVGSSTGVGVTPVNNTNTPGCQSASIVIDNLKNGSNVCSNVTCSRMCNNLKSGPIRDIINSESAAAGVDPRLIAAIACRESSGNVNAVGTDPGGTKDCGLMQITEGSSCTSNLFDATYNIKLGIQKYKGKLSAQSSYNYPNVDKSAQALSAYNCCANGDNPNSRSNDCNTSTGWPQDLPKWACPINPGAGQFNMCTVKSYSCEILSCVGLY